MQTVEKDASIDIASFLVASFNEAPDFNAGFHNQNLLNGENQTIMIAATYAQLLFPICYPVFERS